MKSTNPPLSLFVGLVLCLASAAIAEPGNNAPMPDKAKDVDHKGYADTKDSCRNKTRTDRPHRGGGPREQLMKRIHNAADKNNDGVLNEEEKKEFNRLVGEAKRRMHREILKRFDQDNDGKLSEEEKANARAAGRERMNKLREEAIKRFDKDGDGKLDEEERRTARETVRERMKNRAKRFDENGDGQLDENERRKAREAMRKHMQEQKRNSHNDGARTSERATDERPSRRPQARPERSELLKRFDSDGNGKIDDAERRVLRETLRKERAAASSRDGQ